METVLTTYNKKIDEFLKHNQPLQKKEAIPMAKTAQEVYDEIVAHIKKQGGPFSSWYCGITENIKNRLFGDHNVPEKDHWFIHRPCTSNESARNVEKALLELGCDGGTGGGDANAVHVYAYLKTSITEP